MLFVISSRRAWQHPKNRNLRKRGPVGSAAFHFKVWTVRIQTWPISFDWNAMIISTNPLKVSESSGANLRTPTIAIITTYPISQFQLMPSFAPAETACERHPTSAHPLHSISHHRECCLPVRLTLLIPERMVHA